MGRNDRGCAWAYHQDHDLALCFILRLLKISNHYAPKLMEQFVHKILKNK